MDEDQPKCVLRTQSLCDGSQVLDITRAPRGRCGCYCQTLASVDHAESRLLVDHVRTVRARTVARAAELERLMERHQRLVDRPEGVPPY